MWKEEEITCPKHGSVMQLGNLRCENCVTENIATFNKAFAGMHVTASVPFNTGTVKVGGIERPIYHDTRYVEYSVPAQIEEEILAYIERRVSETLARCPCAHCVQDRAVAA